MVAALAAWEWAVGSGRLPALFFPPPSAIGRSLADLALSGELAGQLGATLRRMGIGCLAGGLPGLALGLAMGWSPRLRTALDPLIAAVHPIPKITLLPLVMIFFGIGETSLVIPIAVGTFFPMLINAMAAIRQISPAHFEVAQNFGASRFKVFTRVIVPASLPLVLTGVRLAVNLALLLALAVELVAGQDGLGRLIWFAWQTLHTEKLYASLATISAVGVLVNWGLYRLTHLLAPWQVERKR